MLNPEIYHKRAYQMEMHPVCCIPIWMSDSCAVTVAMRLRKAGSDDKEATYFTVDWQSLTMTAALSSFSQGSHTHNWKSTERGNVTNHGNDGWNTLVMVINYNVIKLIMFLWNNKSVSFMETDYFVMKYSLDNDHRLYWIFLLLKDNEEKSSIDTEWTNAKKNITQGLNL